MDVDNDSLAVTAAYSACSQYDSLAVTAAYSLAHSVILAVTACSLTV